MIGINKKEGKRRLIRINGKEWHDLTNRDIEEYLASDQAEESFFFEYKDDRVNTQKLTEEISAMANTFGGYIFVGVTDNKELAGCVNWNEQRIHVTIHDSITPTPSFDVKKFDVKGKTVFVIRIDEGDEPPYITNQGKILERLSSGSFVVKDSTKLGNLYNKNQRRLDEILKKISIEPIHTDIVNVYGYIDVGFDLTLTDREQALKAFNDTDLKLVAQDEKQRVPFFNLNRIGNSYVYSPGGLSAGNNKLPGGVNNFVEIMYDGSAKMRLLLFNNDNQETTVNMISPFTLLEHFKTVYERVMGKLFPDSFIYAKKYESLTVLKQFQPFFPFENSMVQSPEEIAQMNKEISTRLQANRSVLGIDTIIASDRIPKIGLYRVDHQMMRDMGYAEYTADTIINELFFSQFVRLGYAIDE